MVESLVAPFVRADSANEIRTMPKLGSMRGKIERSTAQMLGFASSGVSQIAWKSGDGRLALLEMGNALARDDTIITRALIGLVADPAGVCT